MKKPIHADAPISPPEGQRQFNVQPFTSTGSLHTTPYNRRDYYKIWLLVGNSILHYPDKHIDINRPALIFTNPLVPYSLESEAERRTGYTCIFTESFLKAGGRMETIRESTLSGNHTPFLCSINPALYSSSRLSS